jgi:hypothetical protein
MRDRLIDIPIQYPGHDMPQCMTVQAYKHILTPIKITKLTRSSVRQFYYQHLQKYFSLYEAYIIKVLFIMNPVMLILCCQSI